MIVASPETKSPPQVLIVGQGRSGTNWLLELLDLSPRTHCRNEPNEIEGAKLSQLASPHIDQPMPETFGAAWDAAVAAASRSVGERDRHAVSPKGYTWEPVRRLGGRQLMMKERSRRVLSAVMPALRQREWPLPWWLGRHEALERALPVLKFTQTPGWACWVLRHRPQVPVIHIVRHPAGFLNSWTKRYLPEMDRGVVRAENERRLRQIVAADASWEARFGDIGAMSVEQSELWYWVYANEVIFTAGRRTSSYMPVIYERVVADPMGIAREMYRRCGLEMDDRIERGVRASAVESQSIGKRWREQLPAEHVALAGNILQQSFMRDWWNNL